jgi:hypothetical protein
METPFASSEHSSSYAGRQGCYHEHHPHTFIVCILLCVSTVRIKVSHHNKIKQNRHYCIYIRFIISISITTCFDSYWVIFRRLYIKHRLCCQYKFILYSLNIYIYIVTDLLKPSPALRNRGSGHAIPYDVMLYGACAGDVRQRWEAVYYGECW